MGDYDHNPPKETKPNIKNLNKHENKRLYIATFNVRTLSSYDRIIQLEEATKDIKYDIIGISEMRRCGTKIEEYDKFILCQIGQTPGKYGVGFIVNKRLKHCIENFIGITERVALINLNIEGFKLSIIQAYAPTEAAKEEEMEQFYNTINSTINTTHGNLILMGDFNAKIGIPKPEEHLIMKQHGYGKRNDRGQKLIEFARENKLTIINTCFKKKPKRRWTWCSPNGQYKNEIDFIMSKQPQLFQNIETMNINYSSDHRLLRATIKLSKYKKTRSKFTTNQTNSLKNQEEISMYKENLKSRLTDFLTKDTTVQSYYDKIIEAIKESTKEARTKTEGQKHHKILSTRTLNLLQRRKELQKIKNKTRSNRNELSAHYKLTNRYIKRDYENYRLNTIERHLQQRGSTKKAYKELRTKKHG